MKQIELTSKLVVALIAIVVVFSAMTVPVAAQTTSSPPVRANSVTSGSIKDGEVKTADLADGAVTSAKIADGTIQEEDIADGVIPDGGGIQLNVHVVSDTFPIQRGLVDGVEVDCPSGEILTGGGYNAQILGVEILTNAPKDADTWSVIATSTLDAVITVSAYALCIDPSLP